MTNSVWLCQEEQFAHQRSYHVAIKATHFEFTFLSLQLLSTFRDIFFVFCFLFSIIIFDNSIPPTQPSAKQCSGKSIVLPPSKWVVVYSLVCLTLLLFLLPQEAPDPRYNRGQNQKIHSHRKKPNRTLFTPVAATSGFALKLFSHPTHP